MAEATISGRFCKYGIARASHVETPPIERLYEISDFDRFVQTKFSLFIIDSSFLTHGELC
jgi:hypothetical protein